MEEACDQTVLNLRQDINNQFYALTLLKVLTQKSVGLRLTPAMASPKALVIRRLTLLSKRITLSPWLALLFTAVFLGSSAWGVTLTEPVKPVHSALVNKPGDQQRCIFGVFHRSSPALGGSSGHG